MERQVAARYAEALFSLAQEKGQIDEIGEELTFCADLLARQFELRRVLEHPEIDNEKKQALLERTLGDRLSETTLSFLNLLIQRGRIALLSLAAEEFEAFADRARDIQRVQVTAAGELSGDQEKRLRGALEALTGKRVELETAVDPELLAGVRVQIGDRLIDGSAAGRLDSMRAKLKEAGRIG